MKEGLPDTLDIPESALAEQPELVRPGVALVLAWAHDRIDMLGSSMCFVEAARPRTYIFGRGAPSADDPQERILLRTTRPAGDAGGWPLDDRFLSRCQLELTLVPDGLRVKNVGKRVVFVDGNPLEEAVVSPGSVVEIDRMLLFLCVRRAAGSTLRQEPGAARAFGEPDAHGIVGESPVIWSVRDQILFAARRHDHVLVLGPTGSGKELVARAIHQASTRARRRMVARSAATIPHSLADAELFGTAASYPNAGMAERPGLVGEADGSTLFLDEVAELPEEIQTRLLRLMDDGDYQRLGDARRRTADVRIIGATNRPLERLRDDVAARFALRIRVPALSDRPEDIPLLARHLARGIASEDGAGAPLVFGRRLIGALLRHPFLGNVRELRALLLASHATSASGMLDVTPDVVAELARRREPRAVSTATLTPGSFAPPAESEISAEQIREALRRCGGVRERAWRDLGLKSRYVLKRLMQKHGIVGE